MGSPTAQNKHGQTPTYLWIRPSGGNPDILGVALVDSEGNSIPTPLTGTYDYATGTSSATVVVPAGGKVIGLTVIAPTGSSASYAVNAKPAVTVPAGSQIGSGVEGQLVGPTITVTNPASYLIEWTL